MKDISDKTRMMIFSSVIIIMIIIIVGLTYLLNPSSGSEDDEADTYCCPDIEFRREGNTLIVESITPFPDKSNCIDCELYWEYWEIRKWERIEEGVYNWSTDVEFNLPEGSIDVGDEILNCEGWFSILYKPCTCCIIFDNAFSEEWEYKD